MLSTALQGMKDGYDDDDKLEIMPIDLKITGLTPTQNEVVLEKSLPFTLERPDLFANYVSSYKTEVHRSSFSNFDKIFVFVISEQSEFI